MAIVKHVLKRKTENGYDTYHLQSQASLILRYKANGVENGNVETALTNLETRVDNIVSAGGEPNVITAITAGGAAVSVTNKTAAIPAATTSAYGVVKVDNAVNDTSTNPVQTKAVKAAITDAIANAAYIPTSQKGANSGIAELDANGKVPSSQLPSYVDDVIEGYKSGADFFEDSAHTAAKKITGETGKIYVDLSTNVTYRWSGTAYVEISASLALGETESTAYRGDRGKVAYDHSQAAHARTDATAVASSTTNGNIKINGTETKVYSHPTYTAKTSGLYKITVDASGHVSATAAVAKADLTDVIGNFGAASGSAAGSTGLVPAPAAGKNTSFLRGDGTWVVPTNTDTKNTAGSTDSSSKLFLIGATSQAANPQTYSHDTVYVGTDGCLYSNGKRVIDVQVASSQPTGQVTGDFWLETLS
nr:MAG TPA: tail protein [Caudoviricetes sp.]